MGKRSSFLRTSPFCGPALNLGARQGDDPLIFHRSIKVVTIVGLIILGVILDLGGK